MDDTLEITLTTFDIFDSKARSVAATMVKKAFLSTTRRDMADSTAANIAAAMRVTEVAFRDDAYIFSVESSPSLGFKFYFKITITEKQCTILASRNTDVEGEVLAFESRSDRPDPHDDNIISIIIMMRHAFELIMSEVSVVATPPPTPTGTARQQIAEYIASQTRSGAATEISDSDQSLLAVESVRRYTANQFVEGAREKTRSIDRFLETSALP